MQTNNTYTQFEEAAKRENLYGQFSQADLNMARRNPDKGMQMLQYKMDARDAQTPEGLALANQGAETLRKEEGYSGGKDGSGYYAVSAQPAQTSFGYTEADVLKAAKDGGVYDQLSSFDLDLIKNSPEHGMGVVSGKVQYGKATTDKEKEDARRMAENSRMLGGGYTTGADGSGYYKALPSPGDFTYEEAPKYNNNMQGEVDEAYDNLKNFDDFVYYDSKPVYRSEYKRDMDKILREILNQKDFSYDANKDPLYAQYAKQYAREGQRASEDTMGAAAAMTGGLPSSYAVSAAAQAGNYYAAQLTDKIPELYEAAYNRYMHDRDMKLSTLSALGAMDDRMYGRHQDDLKQWNDDRTFAYGTWKDSYGRAKDTLNEAQEMEQTGYDRYADDHERWTDGRDTAYGVYTDNIDHLQGERKYADERADKKIEQDLEERKFNADVDHKKDTLALDKDRLALDVRTQEFDEKYKSDSLAQDWAKYEGNLGLEKDKLAQSQTFHEDNLGLEKDKLAQSQTFHEDNMKLSEKELAANIEKWQVEKEIAISGNNMDRAMQLHGQQLTAAVDYGLKTGDWSRYNNLANKNVTDVTAPLSAKTETKKADLTSALPEPQESGSAGTAAATPQNHTKPTTNNNTKPTSTKADGSKRISNKTEWDEIVNLYGGTIAAMEAGYTYTEGNRR